MALLGQFRQAENKTGSFDETAGYRSCRSPLELCSMWSLRVTNFAQQVRRRSGWRVVRGVDQKCQKTETGRYFIYDYYYVPKHTYYYCTIYNTVYTPNQHHILLYITIHPYTHHIPLLHTIYPYTTTYTPIYPYTTPYTPIYPYTTPYTPIYPYTSP